MAGERFAVKIEGLSKVRSNLRVVDSELPKAIRIAFNGIAEEIAADARSELSSDVRNSTGRAAGSIRAASTQTRAAIKGGGKRVPYYPWLEFGGRVGKNNSVVREHEPGGRYLFVTVRRAREKGDMTDRVEDALAGVFRRAGLNSGR